MVHKLSLLLIMCFSITPSCSQKTPSTHTKHGEIWSEHEWSQKEISQILSMSLSQLEHYQENAASNQYAKNPIAAELGKKIFFDPFFSRSNTVACANCHIESYSMTDPTRLSTGIGLTDRHSMSIINMQFSPWLFWDGRKDSMWSQALGPLESPVEHGGNRTQFMHLIASTPEYRELYEKVFPPLPTLAELRGYPKNASPLSEIEHYQDAWNILPEEKQEIINRVFANIGKSIAAFERTIYPFASRFDQFVEAIRFNNENVFLNENELHGLKIFLTKGHCVECHSGPLFSNHDFHNTGVPQNSNKFDTGRFDGVEALIQDPFNCLGPYSDATNKKKDCAETLYAKRGDESLKGSFKVPSLRNVAITAPYMHAGQFERLEDVIDHYTLAPAASIGRSELFALDLSEEEKQYLIEFLSTLTSFVIVP